MLKLWQYVAEHAAREGDAFDQELQGQLAAKRRVEHEEGVKVGRCRFTPG